MTPGMVRVSVVWENVVPRLVVERYQSDCISKNNTVKVSSGLVKSNSDCCYLIAAPYFGAVMKACFSDFVELFIPLGKGSKAISERG